MLLGIFTYPTVTGLYFTDQPKLNFQNRVLYNVCNGLYNIFLLRIPKEDGEIKHMQDLLHFCVRPWFLLTILNFFVRWPTDTTVF